MTSGREILHRIDAAIAEARRLTAEAGGAAAETSRTAAALDARELDTFRALAAMRIDLLKSDTIESSLGAVDRRARELIAQQDAHVAETQRARDAAAARLERLERDRRGAEDAHDDAVRRHDEAAAETRRRIEKDPAYVKLADALEDADAVSKRAEQKLELAREDRTAKGAAYEADPLFVYLKKRAFGTRDYRAFPLFAIGDAWVAGLIKYRDARLNYDRLLEIPERLEEHLEAVKRLAAVKADEIEAFERAALERDGVNALRDAAAAAAKRIEEIDAEIASAEAEHKKCAAAFTAAASGASGPAGEARDLLVEALGRRPIPDLKLLAAETASREDDRLVDELVRLRRERMEYEEAKRTSAAAAQRRARSADQLEDLRRRFKQARYDSPYSEFPGGNIIGSILGEVIAEALDLDDAWKKIARSQRTRRRDWDDDFGGADWRGGLGYPRGDWGGGNWGGGNWGGSRPGSPLGRPPSVPHIPRAPRVPGGFRTGGGFGGGRGGFKTGGGF
jgi:hypothetical protein